MMPSEQRDDLMRFPILGERTPGMTQQHLVALPGAALGSERWPVVSVTGAQAGPVVFINAGVHGTEYPAIEAVIRLGKLLDPATLSGTVVLMPIVNLPAFWQRRMFVCPVDGVNPNRVFPGDPAGSYSQQLVYALTTEFIAHADLYIDLHGGDMVEDLVPLCICRKVTSEAERKAEEYAKLFGAPYLIYQDKPLPTQADPSIAAPPKGDVSISAALERGIPAFVAEAGAVGQLQPEAVAFHLTGVQRVLQHLKMIAATVSPAESQPIPLTRWEWLYTGTAGMFYAQVRVNDAVVAGQVMGVVHSLFGEPVETIIAPASGYITFLTTSPAVTAKTLVLSIGVR